MDDDLVSSFQKSGSKTGENSGQHWGNITLWKSQMSDSERHKDRFSDD